MQVVRALFDGREIKTVDPIKSKKPTEVLVIFPNDFERVSPVDARRLLRGAGKGENLTDKLLKSRKEDLARERR